MSKQKTLPKFISEGLEQRRIQWYIDLIDEGYTQGQIAEFEKLSPQAIYHRIKSFEGVFISAPGKGTRPRRIIENDKTTSDTTTNATK